MDTMTLTGSQENALLDVCDESLSNRRVIDQPWAKWTEDDKKTLMDYIHYHTNCIEFVNKCWASGITTEKPPKKPEGDLEKLVKKGRKRKGKMPSNSETPAKVKKNSISQMNDDEFIVFLEGKIVKDIEVVSTTVRMPYRDLGDVAKHLNSWHEKVEKEECALLRNHLQFGQYITGAKDFFDAEKIQKKTSETWAAWVNNNTRFKAAYARKHKEVSALVLRYPKLARLAVSFTELYKMKNRIKAVFAKNAAVGDLWKGE